MSMTVDRPPSSNRSQRQNVEADFESDSAQSAVVPRYRKRSLLERYQSHLLIGGLSLLVIFIASSPLILGSMSRSTLTRVTEIGRAHV